MLNDAGALERGYYYYTLNCLHHMTSVSHALLFALPLLMEKQQKSRVERTGGKFSQTIMKDM